ncbi:MAG: hypothetical protein V1767_07945 [Chloroflexota bacterium]
MTDHEDNEMMRPRYVPPEPSTRSIQVFHPRVGLLVGFNRGCSKQPLLKPENLLNTRNYKYRLQMVPIEIGLDMYVFRRAR